jgi:hypothetical protein
MNFQSVRSAFVSTTLTGSRSSVSPGFPIERFNLVYTDSAPGNTLAIQTLLNDGSTWVTIQTVTTLASGVVSLTGPFLDVRANVTAHTVSGTIIADIFAQG